MRSDHHSPEQIDDLLQLAYAAAHHWRRAAGGTTINCARAAWLLSRVHAVLGHGDLALHHARRREELTAEAGELAADFDHGYALEARARSLACLGHDEEATSLRLRAAETEVHDAEDREIYEADLAAGP